MTSRLVVGSGSLAGTLVNALSERRGSLSVLSADENAAQTLREEGVAAEAVDPTDAAAYDDRDPPDTVAVATDDPETNLAAARAVAGAFPDAFLLAYAGANTGTDTTAALRSVADAVVDPGTEMSEYLRERIGDPGLRTRKLSGTLRDVEEPLAIVTHKNPDPDAIASAVALSRIAATVGLDADICYFGEITHHENRAFVNLLEYDLRKLEPGEDVSGYGGVALVDHSQPGVNDGLPQGTPVDIVIDHHPPRYPVEARFVDLRSDVGATSTLLVEHLQGLNVTLDREVATGLLFGIHVDTDGFTREASVADFEAAAVLQPHADLGTLERIESPSMSGETLDTIGRAITNRDRHGPVLVSGVGQLNDRDSLAQAADRLLDLDEVEITFVYGIADGTVYVSARARGTDVDLGETLRAAFGQIGSAGGHADMAGAQLSLGVLNTIDEDEESLSEVVSSVVTDRFLGSLDPDTHRVMTDAYPDDFHGVDERVGDDPPGVDNPEVADPMVESVDDSDGSPADESVDDSDGSPADESVDDSDGSPADESVDGENGA